MASKLHGPWAMANHEVQGRKTRGMIDSKHLMLGLLTGMLGEVSGHDLGPSVGAIVHHELRGPLDLLSYCDAQLPRILLHMVDGLRGCSSEDGRTLLSTLLDGLRGCSSGGEWAPLPLLLRPYALRGERRTSRARQGDRGKGLMRFKTKEKPRTLPRGDSGPAAGAEEEEEEERWRGKTRGRRRRGARASASDMASPGTRLRGDGLGRRGVSDSGTQREGAVRRWIPIYVFYSSIESVAEDVLVFFFFFF